MLLYACSFDAAVYETADFDPANGRALSEAYYFGWSTTGGPFSTGAAQLAGFEPRRFAVDLPSEQTTFYAGFYVYIADIDRADEIRFKSLTAGAGNTLCKLKFPGGAEAILYENDATAHATGLVLNADTWYFVEVKVVLHATTGSIELRVNGVGTYTMSGVDTIGADSGCRSVQVYATNDGPSSNTDYDDIAFWNDDDHPDDSVGGHSMTGFQGPWRMTPVKPNADTAQADWTPSAGSDNYAMVDDADNDEDATYVASTTLTDRDELDLEAGPSYQIIAVQAVVAARKVDAGNADLTVGIKSSSAEGSTTTTLGEGAIYGHHRHAQDVDPNTGEEWTEAAFNAAKLLYENG